MAFPTKDDNILIKLVIWQVNILILDDFLEKNNEECIKLLNGKSQNVYLDKIR